MLLASAIAAVILPERLWAMDALQSHAVPLCCAVVLTALTTIAAHFGGAFFNPALSLAAVIRGTLSRADGMAYAGAQIAGAFIGVTAAQAGLNLDAVQEPVEAAVSFGAVASEFMATFFFVCVVCVVEAQRRSPLVNGLAAGLTFLLLNEITPLMSFANPAATIARTLTSSALSLSPWQAGLAVAAQLLGAAAAILILARRP
jgi:glycerol uptake facilitator-like aquaporin